ncbi:MAG: hypothetical protein KKI08_04590 [Armatimonadetes bacterium]|nr:hypothetical protein [Armatimonadota bacterium]
MARRLVLLLCLAAVVALACGSDECECDNDEEQGEIAVEAASYLALISVMDKASRAHGLSPAQLPETVEITNADLRLGPSVQATGVRTASDANAADFEGATAHRGTIHLTGLFTREGNDFVIALTTLLPFQAGDSVGMTMQVTFTSNDHAAGTVQYVEDGETYTGTVELERYPE